MKTTIDKEFFEKWKNKDVAMWCKKKEYAEEFCRLMDENGLETYDGSSFLFKNTWELFEDLTVYEFNTGNYSNKKGCSENGYTLLDFEDYIVKEKMTKQELVELLAENFINEQGTLDLSNLDFRTLDCDVDISGMKVSRTLVQSNQKADNIFQDEQEVGGSLFQNRHKVGGNLYQDNQKVQVDLHQGNQYVEGDLLQHNQKVQGTLFQSNQEVRKDLYQSNQEVQGDLFQERVENKLIGNEPSHYSIAGIDTMNLILTICEHNNTNTREGFYLANTLKYLIRHNNKNGIEDLKKAKDYLNRLIEQKTLEDLPFYDVDGQGE